MAEMLQELAVLYARLEALQTQNHLQALAREGDGMNPVVPDQFEQFYAGLDDLRDDRAEYSEAQELGALHARLEALHQAPAQTQDREHGMGY
jgi:hypothetical protein